jgi:hypothetical protein
MIVLPGGMAGKEFMGRLEIVTVMDLIGLFFGVIFPKKEDFLKKAGQDLTKGKNHSIISTC